MDSSTNSKEAVEALKSNYRREIEAAASYQNLADREQDVQRKAILEKLAKTELDHAEKWAAKLKSMGVNELPVVKESVWRKLQRNSSNLATNLERMELEEHRNIAAYENQKKFNDQEWTELLDEIEADERKHASSVRALMTGSGSDPQRTLDLLWSRERWHKRGGTGWVGDAVYGVNDGLGAVFGIISGVACFSSSSQFILISGLAGMISSALSRRIKFPSALFKFFYKRSRNQQQYDRYQCENDHLNKEIRNKKSDDTCDYPSDCDPHNHKCRTHQFDDPKDDRQSYPQQ